MGFAQPDGFPVFPGALPQPDSCPNLNGGLPPPGDALPLAADSKSNNLAIAMAALVTFQIGHSAAHRPGFDS